TGDSRVVGADTETMNRGRNGAADASRPDRLSLEANLVSLRSLNAAPPAGECRQAVAGTRLGGAEVQTRVTFAACSTLSPVVCSLRVTFALRNHRRCVGASSICLSSDRSRYAAPLSVQCVVSVRDIRPRCSPSDANAQSQCDQQT